MFSDSFQWAFILSIMLIIPVIMLAGGWILSKHSVRYYNCRLAYRTKRSLQNRQSWHFAQTYGGRLLIRTGSLVLMLCALMICVLTFTISPIREASGLMSILLECVVMVLTISLVENALKDRFPETSEV